MLNKVQYANLSNHLKAEEAAVRAVVEVESKGNGFLPNGKPKILFEGHIFWRELKKAGIDPARHLKGNEDILYQKWTKSFYKKSGEQEYERLGRAVQIDEEAALKSASWGAFQLMGFHAKALGFASAKAFVEAQQSAAGQVESFLLFVRSNPPMLKALRDRNWEKFAERYNGKEYKKNKYDSQLRKHYEKFNGLAREAEKEKVLPLVHP